MLRYVVSVEEIHFSSNSNMHALIVLLVNTQ